MSAGYFPRWVAMPRPVMAPPPAPEVLPAVLMFMSFLEDRKLLRTLAVFREESAYLWMPFAVRK